MAHHNGPRKKTRYKFRKPLRKRGTPPVTLVIREYEIGSRVHIVVEPSVHRGMPPRRFHGRTGTVTGRRGRAYVVSVPDGNTRKTIIVRPQHLKPQKN